jgi:hypothetical protein
MAGASPSRAYSRDCARRTHSSLVRRTTCGSAAEAEKLLGHGGELRRKELHPRQADGLLKGDGGGGGEVTTLRASLYAAPAHNSGGPRDQSTI